MTSATPDIDATPLVLLCGLLCDARIWAPQVDALGGSTRIEVIRFAGFDDLGTMAAHVLDVVDGPFNLVGHSMGARVALEVVRQAPARVRRLALLDTGVHPADAAEPARRQVLLDLARDHGMAALAARWLPPMLHPARSADPALMAALTDMVEAHSLTEFNGQIRALLARPDAAPLLPSLACPVLVGVGREDAWSPLAQHEAMCALIPDARLAVFENSGHMAPLEAPDAVNAALRDWLATPAGASASP